MVTKLPMALGHLLALDLEEAVVHPDIGHDVGAMGAAALRDLVLMVGEHQVDAATMDVEGDARGASPTWPSIPGASRDGRSH